MTPPKEKRQCPPPPPSSPAHSRGDSGMETDHSQRGPQHPQLPQQQIANLLQSAQMSYSNNNPTDALSALMDALSLSSGHGAAQHAMDRIRAELGDSVADSVAGGRTQQPPTQLSDREMTLKAMQVVQELLNDESTILYAQGKQHLLQQAMEDGSSVVCSVCGDMISRERMTQHAEYWCRGIEEGKNCDEGEGMAMDE
ncbi:hypothetical protein ACHAXT_003003 [Thalassiosira profunda]